MDMYTSLQICKDNAKIMHRAFLQHPAEWASPWPAVLTCYAVACKITKFKDQKQQFKSSKYYSLLKGVARGGSGVSQEPSFLNMTMDYVCFKPLVARRLVHALASETLRNEEYAPLVTGV